MKKEELMIFYNVYSGILAVNNEFKNEGKSKFVYDFDAPELITLKEKYNLKRIAKNGSSFEKGKRLLHYLAIRLHHSPWYDNHIECNSLKLLEYSLNNKEQGINCLNKSKILAECCLALGIYARRVAIAPYSPYDCDSHVVTEIFDEVYNKWIMLDTTTDGYFINESKTPLSIYEIRQYMAQQKFVTFVKTNDSLDDINKLRDKYFEYTVYISKNIFRFYIETYNGFGVKNELGYNFYTPLNINILKNNLINLEYRLDNIPSDHEELRPIILKNMEKLKKDNDPVSSDIAGYLESPYQK